MAAPEFFFACFCFEQMKEEERARQAELRLHQQAHHGGRPGNRQRECLQ